MKKTIFLLFTSVALVMATGCNSTTELNEVSGANLATTTPIQTSTNMMIYANMDIGKFYSSVESLSQAASIVVQGEVQNHEYFQFERVAYTKSIIKVTKVISGDVAVGDLVIFVERGGIRTKGEIAERKPGKIIVKPGEENDPVPVVFNGIENMKKGDKVLLFGKLDNRKTVLSQDFYVCVGSFQGKFQVNGNVVERLVGNVDIGDGKKLPNLKMELTQLEAKVKSVKK